MDGLDFIKLYETIEEALYVKSAPTDTIFSLREVQLLPNNELPYIQRSSYSKGVNVEDYTVNLIQLCDGQKEDITAYFDVDYVFPDGKGNDQIQWRLTNLPTDYYSKFVYLEINQALGGQFYYSTPFLLTSLDQERTSRFDYGCILHEEMQSIQLRMYFRQELMESLIDSYNELSTSNTVTVTTQESEFDKYVTDVFSSRRLKELSKIFKEIYVFVDLKRANLYRNIEIPEITGNVSSVIQTSIYLSFESLTYDPLYTPPEQLGDYNSNDYNNIDYKTT